MSHRKKLEKMINSREPANELDIDNCENQEFETL